MSRLKLGGFVRQVGWSFLGRIVSALLQLAIVVLLARGLEPTRFAHVASVSVTMMAVVALNGFGLVRQLQFRRSLDANDPTLPAIFALWQRFSLGSGVLWLAGCLGLHLATGDRFFLQLLPIAVWLQFEQLTTVWNAISLVDDRARDLVPSYVSRRGPVVVALLVALAADLDVVWTWSLSMAAGSVLAYAVGLRRAVPWSRRVLPGPRPPGDVAFDFGFWWTEVGGQLRDLDVAAITLVSAATGGAYALPARLVRPMNLVTGAAAAVAFPRIARMAMVSPRQLLLGCVIGTGPVAAIAAATAAVAGLLPRLVGDGYADAVPVLRVLCLAALVTGFGALVVMFLQARSRAANRFTGRVTLALAVVQVAAAAVVTSVGDAVTVAWTVTGLTALGVAVLYARAAHECRLEAVSGGRAGPSGPTPPRTPPGHSASS